MQIILDPRIPYLFIYWHVYPSSNHLLLSLGNEMRNEEGKKRGKSRRGRVIRGREVGRKEYRREK